MQAHTARVADWLRAPRRRQTPLITRMAGFVQYRHQRRGEIAFVIARGDAHIFRNATAKRMMALVQSAMIEIESESLHQGSGKRLLLCHRKRTLGTKRRRRARLLGEDLRQKVRKKCRQVIENDVYLGALESRIIAVDQGVVRGEAKCRRLGFRLFTNQGKQWLEGFLEGSEIVRRARLTPHHFASRRGSAESRHQFRRQRIGVSPAVAHFSKIGVLPGA